MFSSEGEKVTMGKNLKVIPLLRLCSSSTLNQARGSVEEWLTAVEKRFAHHSD
jgi:hypothetical protein